MSESSVALPGRSRPQDDGSSEKTPPVMGRRNERFMLLAVCLLSALLLSPTLDCGYQFDDITNSLEPGRETEQGITPLAAYVAEVKAWATQQGRFFPIAFHFILTFSFLTNAQLYRSLILLSVLANIFMFARFIRGLTGSPALGILAALVVTMLFQLRMFYDPILGFAFLLQILFLFLVGSLLALDRYLQSGRVRHLWASLLCYALSLLTYEATYTCGILHCLLICSRLDAGQGARRAKLSLPFLLVPLAFACLIILMRLHVGVGILAGSGNRAIYAIGFSPDVYLKTLAKQVLGAVPLSYFLFGPFKSQAVPYFLARINLETLVLHVAVLFCCLILLRWVGRRESGRGSNDGIREISSWRLLVLGLLLTVLPGVLVALVPRYQKELFKGAAHIPVYLSYFGVATAIIAGLGATLKKVPGGDVGHLLAATAAALLLTAVGLIHHTNNRMVVEQLTSQYYHPRMLIERGMRHGLFRQVPDGACLVMGFSPPWEENGASTLNARAFFRMHTGLGLHVIKKEDLREQTASDGLRMEQVTIGNSLAWAKITAADAVFYVDGNCSDRDRGFAVLGRVHSLAACQGQLFGVAASSALLYVQIPFFHPDYIIQGTWVDAGRMTGAGDFFLDPGQRKVVSAGADWQLCEVSAEPGKLMDLRSLKVVYGRR